MEEFVFWDNVKYMLEVKNMYQKELSFIAGINDGTLKNQISKNVIPSVTEAADIAFALGCSIEFLLTGKEIKEKIPDDLQKVIDKYATK